MWPAWRLPAARLLAAALGLLAATAAGAAEPEGPALRLVGRGLYLEHCAVCHGESARGAGPVAETLSTRPSNLEALAHRHEAPWFFQRMSEGWRQMHPQRHNLTAAQRWHIALYLVSLRR